jgi:hypothetical protein
MCALVAAGIAGLSCAKDDSRSDDFGSDGGGADDGGQDDGSGDGGTGGTEDGGDGDDSGGTDDDTSDDGGIKLDVSSGGDVPGDGSDEEGCKKIDFLFVIDNSNSMSDEQQLLIDAFPGFVEAITQTLPDATDFHLGVTKTDVFGFDDSPTADPANPCAYELGGLLSHATDPDAKTGIGASCNFASGTSYMTNTPDLAAEFQCVAYVGTEGNTGEKQAEATLEALSPAKAAPGQCSEGFLREDALLVLVVITDEDDDWSAPDSDLETNAQAWFDGVAGAKGGIETNVVFLLISGGSPKWPTCGPLDFQTMTGADASPKLTAWAELADAVATIETACDEFTPPP